MHGTIHTAQPRLGYLTILGQHILPPGLHPFLAAPRNARLLSLKFFSPPTHPTSEWLPHCHTPQLPPVPARMCSLQQNRCNTTCPASLHLASHIRYTHSAVVSLHRNAHTVTPSYEFVPRLLSTRMRPFGHYDPTCRTAGYKPAAYHCVKTVPSPSRIVLTGRVTHQNNGGPASPTCTG